MSDQEKNTTPTPTKRSKVKIDLTPDTLQTCSFQVPHVTHQILESANQESKLDKAGVVRLAVRLFISRYYQGNGAWSFPSDVQEEMIFADSAKYFMRGLKS